MYGIIGLENYTAKEITAASWWDLASDSELSFRLSFSGIGSFLAEMSTITANFILSKGDDSWPNWYQFQGFLLVKITSFFGVLTLEMRGRT